MQRGSPDHQKIVSDELKASGSGTFHEMWADASLNGDSRIMGHPSRLLGIKGQLMTFHTGSSLNLGVHAEGAGHLPTLTPHQPHAAQPRRGRLGNNVVI
jgi:hypothetical protein